MYCSQDWFRKAFGNVEEINKLTTGKAGLSANSMIKKREASEWKLREEIQDQLGDAFVNLAMAATAKSNTIGNLVSSMTKLTANIAKQNEENIKLTEDLKGALAATKISNTIEKVPDAWANPNEYCWTCGYKVGWKHKSSNCRSQAEGHTYDAKRQNTMGGSKKGTGFGITPNRK